MDGGGPRGAGGAGPSRPRATGRTAASSEANRLHVVTNLLRQMEAHAADQHAELVALRAAAQYVVNTLGAGDPASLLHNRLLHVPNRMHVLVRRGIRRGAIVAMAMAEACTDADCSSITGFPNADPLAHQDLQRFHPTGVAVEAMVPVQDIVNGAD